MHIRPRHNISATGYVTQVVYISKSLILRSGYTSRFTDPPDPSANPTILDAEGGGRVVYITGAVSPTLEGLQFTGGNASGGQPASRSPTPTIWTCTPRLPISCPITSPPTIKSSGPTNSWPARGIPWQRTVVVDTALGYGGLLTSLVQVTGVLTGDGESNIINQTKGDSGQTSPPCFCQAKTTI